MSKPYPTGWQRRWAVQALKGIDRLESYLNPLRGRLEKDPYYRFRSYEEVRAAVRLGVRIDVSHATVDDWLRLPGLSIHQARTLSALVHRGVPLMSIEDVAAALHLPLQRLRPLEPILEFRYYDPPPNPTLDINQVSGPQLLQIPGMTPHFAQQLIYHRRLGPYRSWEDLQQRLRLPPEQVGHLIHYLQVAPRP
ncbi:MAG: helix-hairpin-helix domain-containing protein [Cyanobacteria bacterium J06632_22]